MGHCLPTLRASIHAFGLLDYEIHVENQQSLGRVMWFDGEYGLGYECSDPTADGGCEAGSGTISMYSHTRDISDAMFDHVLSFLDESCMKKEDMEKVHHQCK
jgi:hypothetical protein